MTNKRIRYAKVRPGVLVSRRNFMTSGGTEVVVELDTNQKKYRVLDSVSGLEVVPASGDTSNISVLKIQAKAHLVSLGVVFAEETRDRDGIDAANRSLFAPAELGE